MPKPFTKAQAIGLMFLALGTLPVSGVLTTIYSLSFHGPGGHYGIYAAGGPLLSGAPPGWRDVEVVFLQFGPMGRLELSRGQAEIAAVGLVAAAVVALVFLKCSKRGHERTTA